MATLTKNSPIYLKFKENIIKGWAMDFLSKKVDQYEVLEKISEEYTQIVYLALDTKNNKKVVIKKINDVEVNCQREFLRCFINEAVILTKLDHPCIVKLVGVGNAYEAAYSVFEYIEGMRLSSLLTKQTILPNQALKIVYSIANALEYGFNKCGLVYRGIVPKNIVIPKSGEPGAKLVDFSLAKTDNLDAMYSDIEDFCELVSLEKSYHYLAPEQFFDVYNRVSHTADIYGLGAILYHMLAHKHPYYEFTGTAVVKAIIENKFIPLEKAHPGLPVSIYRMVATMMERKPENRYCAKELKQAIVSFINSL